MNTTNSLSAHAVSSLHNTTFYTKTQKASFLWQATLGAETKTDTKKL